MARIKGSSRMLKVLRKAARGALELRPGAPSDRPALLRRRYGAGGGPADRRSAAGRRLRRRLELDADELQRIRQPCSAAPPRSTCCARAPASCCWTPCGRKSGRAPAATPTRSWPPSCAPRFDEDITTEDDFIGFLDAWWPELTPRGVLAAMADERRLGRWSRRVLNPREVRQLARSLRRLDAEGRARCPCTTWRCWTSSSALLGAPARPSEDARAGPAGPAHRAGGADADAAQETAARSAPSGSRRSAPSTRTSSSTRRRT